MSIKKSKSWVVNGLREFVNFRKVVVPTPEVLPACRNCGHYACDHNDRQGAKGVYFEIANSRCLKHVFSVSRNTVCDSHAFRYKDRRDV